MLLHSHVQVGVKLMTVVHWKLTSVSSMIWYRLLLTVILAHIFRRHHYENDRPKYREQYRRQGRQTVVESKRVGAKANRIKDVKK